MQDPIAPSVARHAEETVELVCQAVSGGDLEAAVAQYESDALLRPWASGGSAPSGSAASNGAVAVPSPGPTASQSTALLLRHLMDLRLPLVVRVREIVAAGDLALVVGERMMDGVGTAGQRVSFRGVGATVVRRQPGGGWRIAADAWQLTGPDGVG